MLAKQQHACSFKMFKIIITTVVKSKKAKNNRCKEKISMRLSYVDNYVVKIALMILFLKVVKLVSEVTSYGKSFQSFIP
jgi:hypothetical protein